MILGRSRSVSRQKEDQRATMTVLDVCESGIAASELRLSALLLLLCTKLLRLVASLIAVSREQ